MGRRRNLVSPDLPSGTVPKSFLHSHLISRQIRGGGGGGESLRTFKERFKPHMHFILAQIANGEAARQLGEDNPEICNALHTGCCCRGMQLVIEFGIGPAPVKVSVSGTKG